MKRLALITIILVLAGCRAKQNDGAAPDVEASLVAVSPQETGEEQTQDLIVPTKSEPVGRKLVKNGRIAFETDDANKTRKTILAAVKASRGYIGQDNEARSSDEISHTMVVHVPTAGFETFLASATKGVTEFRHKSISSEDVTARYVDTQSRIKTKKEIEIRYRALLGKATKVKEILEIEAQLGEIRTDIEAMEAQFKQLNNDVEYATLEIVFFKPIYTSNPFMSELANAFGNGLDNLRAFTVVLVAIWPFVLLAVGVVAIFNWWKKKRKKVSEQEAAELS